MDMRFLRNICKVFLKDRRRGSGFRGRSGLKEDVVTRVERVQCTSSVQRTRGIRLAVRAQPQVANNIFQRAARPSTPLDAPTPERAAAVVDGAAAAPGAGHAGSRRITYERARGLKASPVICICAAAGYANIFFLPPTRPGAFSAFPTPGRGNTSGARFEKIYALRRIIKCGTNLLTFEMCYASCGRSRGAAGREGRVRRDAQIYVDAGGECAGSVNDRNILVWLKQKRRRRAGAAAAPSRRHNKPFNSIRQDGRGRQRTGVIIQWGTPTFSYYFASVSFGLVLDYISRFIACSSKVVRVRLQEGERRVHLIPRRECRDPTADGPLTALFVATALLNSPRAGVHVCTLAHPTRLLTLG
ncbi:hypothetical protein EVAR_68122_1 [Eumeta japonica]|uniref:Uncharacterized protein n=1 Tax=Eumeta variegata TaxID=151549 RepID=A0A4C1ZFZ5_EUMVA|nr:hypothetical protein EVAR_68122_1 [Eumeta japonica]